MSCGSRATKIRRMAVKLSTAAPVATQRRRQQRAGQISRDARRECTTEAATGRERQATPPTATSAGRRLDDQFDESGRHPGTVATSSDEKDWLPDGYGAGDL